eukprot:3080599-Alexandrium_andersonii.AAC.1
MEEVRWRELAASAKAWREAFEQWQAAATSAGSTDSASGPSVQPTGRIPVGDFDLRLCVEEAASVEGAIRT